MIQLTQTEQKLFQFLKEVVANKAPNTTLRIAGGWVRDKLLGLESHDIDITIDNMSGQDFAKLITNKITVIEARPDQSKHLETAEVRLFDHIIDFVNLRKENYSYSRIPEIQPGTPEEDASRRDLTINALYFNLNTEKVEDFTGFGLNDLNKKIARTPINSLQTFIDDPLRVLRAIRFACKFNLKLHQELKDAAKHPDVHEAFKIKISKERVWVEMIGQQEANGWKLGFLTGPQPIRALMLLSNLGYRDILFKPSKELNSWDSDQNNPHHNLTVWRHTITLLQRLISINHGVSIEDKIVRYLAAIFHDIGKCDSCYRQEFRSFDGNTYYHYYEHEVGSAAHAMEILNNLKAPVYIRDRVVRLVAEHMRLHVLENNPTNKALRRFLRDLETDWEHSVDLAIADAYGKLGVKNNYEIRNKYDNYRNRLSALLTEQQGNPKPIRPINGNEIMSELNLKPGPVIGLLFKALDDELLERPNLTREEALLLVRQVHTNMG